MIFSFLGYDDHIVGIDFDLLMYHKMNQSLGHLLICGPKRYLSRLAYVFLSHFDLIIPAYLSIKALHDPRYYRLEQLCRLIFLDYLKMVDRVRETPGL